MQKSQSAFIKVVWTCGLAVTIAAALGACGRPTTQDTKPTASTIIIKGSDTMVHLVSSWTEDYMKAHPDTSLSVTGGGSGTGIAALINGTTDLCASSRDIKPEERANAEKKGRKIAEHRVALDAIAVIVGKQNPVAELTMDQLKQIYMGTVTRWSQVGGPDQPIQVISRESSSGTYAFFQEHVLQNEDYVVTAQLLPATAAIVQAISSDPWSIGYVGLGYAEEAKTSVKTVAIKKDASSPAVAPSVETVLSGAYSISRALYLYSTDPTSAPVKAFLDYCVSAQGQEVVAKTGFVRVSK